MRLPSVATIMRIGCDKSQAKQIRKILETPWETPGTSLRRANAYIPLGCGVERIDKGHNKKSPAILYVNRGDTYDTTLMYVSGRGFVVGCWGDIVERGHYD